jgi:hypothetical protein
MIPVDGDAFVDATFCEVCGRESCEDHLPPDPERTPDDRHEQRVLWAFQQERAKREARRRLDAEERGPVMLPDFETLRTRLARAVPVIRWRIQGWQPCETRVMLAAQFKAGKSTVVANLLRALVDGDDWLGRAHVEPIGGTAVLVDLEMGATQLDAWYRAQHIRADDRVIVLPMRGRASSFNLLDDAIRAQWADRLRRYTTRYLVLDCFRPMLDALGLDEHSEAGQFLVAFDRLLAEAGIPEACVVQHMGHAGERSRGDSRLRDWPDVEWRLVRRDEDPSSERFITAYGRDVEQSESQLIYHGDTRRLTMAGGSRKDATTRDALDAVLAVLDADPQPQSGRQIKVALADAEVSRDAIDAALRYGVRSGALTVQDGARRARLYRPVSGSVRECSADTVSECPAAYIEPDTHTLTGPRVTGDEYRTLKRADSC